MCPPIQRSLQNTMYMHAIANLNARQALQDLLSGSTFDNWQPFPGPPKQNGRLIFSQATSQLPPFTSSLLDILFHDASFVQHAPGTVQVE